MDREAISNLTPTPRDLIFSCVICQITLSQARERGNIRSSPPTSTYNSADRTFWLAECAHVICSKHLDTEASRTLRTTLVAPCPLCSNERDDKRPKTLYAIFGFQNGQFDKDIPNVWFDVPPLKLDSSGLGMEALRFQYLSLIRYGTMTGRRIRELEIRNGVLLDNYSHLKRDCDSFRQETNDLKDQISDLERYKKELMRWRAKEKMIVRHLKAVKNVVKENNYLRLQLSNLGCAVPKVDYFPGDDRENVSMPESGGGPNELIERKSDYIKDEGCRHVVQGSDTRSKRKFTENQDSIESRLKHHRQDSSRDLMPPPISDDSLERFIIVPNNHQEVSPQKLKNNLNNFQTDDDNLQRKTSDRFEAFESVPLPDRVGIGKIDPNTIRDSNYLDTPTANKTNYLLPIEQYRYRIDKQPTRTRQLRPAYHEKQLEPCGSISPSFRPLRSRGFRTSDEDGMNSIGMSNPSNGLAFNRNSNFRNGRIMSSVAKDLYPRSTYGNASSPGDVRSTQVGRQFPENEKLAHNREPARESTKSFEQAKLVPRIYHEPSYKRKVSVTSPFFERKSKLPQTPDLGRARYSYQARKYPSSINRSHTQGRHHHLRGFDDQLINQFQKPGYCSEEKGRFKRYSYHGLGIDSERHSTSIVPRSNNSLFFSNHRSLSNAPYTTPALGAPSRSSLTVSSAIPNWMNTQSVSSPVRPFGAFQRNSPARRQYSSLQSNASQFPSRQQIPLEDNWPSPSYAVRRSIRR